MKLKPVVASLAMLGLMAPAAFAKGTLASQQAVLNQNSVVTPLCAKNWFDRIQIGGVGKVIGVIGSNSPAGTFVDSSNGSDLYVNNFNLLLNAKLSSWSRVDANFAYLGAPRYKGRQELQDNNGSTYCPCTSERYNYKRHTVVLDEAYVTIGDLTKHPFYLVAGKKYLPFGDYPTYTPWQIMSPAQMIAQTNATTVIGGLSSDFGLYASLFIFKGERSSKNNMTVNVRDFGAKLGYYSMLDEFNLDNTSVNISLGYLNNIWNTDMFSGATPWKTTKGCDYNHDRTGAAAAHINLAYKAFSMYANWVGALGDMTSTDDTNIWGADVGMDYAFKTLGHNSHLGAAIQWSDNVESSVLGSCLMNVVPKWRLVGEYGVELFKNTELTLAIAHGKSHKIDNDNDRDTTLGLASLSVKL